MQMAMVSGEFGSFSCKMDVTHWDNSLGSVEIFSCLITVWLESMMQMSINLSDRSIPMYNWYFIMIVFRG